MNRDSPHVDPARLVDLLESRLEGDERRAVAAHLEHCGTCRAELALAREATAVPPGATLGDRTERLTRSFRDLLDERLSAPAEVIAQAPPPPADRRRRSSWVVGGLLAASLAVVAVGMHQADRSPSFHPHEPTLRAVAPGTHLAVTVQETGASAWRLASHVDPALRDPVVVVTTAQGEIALRKPLPGERFSIARSDLGESALAGAVFVQIVATDAAGDTVRSKPVLLPR